ncbi:ribonucleotide reductase [Invertebrate iridescent virus 30]|uniref:Ribonucleoside-diphosphate reductase n=1 Tax=Invertebrate iridescent virus 30 TaxID=345585 RepID=S0BE02_9VIRU|nr:ribonucleotide reductase [Invertebrate iridescent virus 30]CCA64450.1 ribonucleoside-diphosphate reductase large subunit [Invertebrate iridescent virus 30]CCV02338.1 ribonucleoside-diphosphate reductase large chain precursor [Invertebrate iridescent virus 30]
MITTVESRNKLLDNLGQIRLKESYMRPEETSPQERFAFVAKAFSGNDDLLAQRLYNYISNHWLSPSSPQLSFGRTKQGLPIACFLPYLPDTTRGLIDTWAEVSELSVIGGGIGLGVGIRQPDDKSVGIIPHLRTYDASCTAYKQGQTRRGSYAAYLDISHPEIISFLNTRRVSGVGGDYNFKLMNIHNGVNIFDELMRKIWFVATITPILKNEKLKKSEKLVELQKAIQLFKNSQKWVDDAFYPIEKLTLENASNYLLEFNKWNLIDPHTKEVKEVISATELWERILITRAETGEPYIHFIDTSNHHLPKFQKKLGLSIKQSNLCVVGETLILTDNGPYPIKSLVDKEISVWNGDEWSDVTVVQTGTDQELVKVDFSNGTFLKCTPYHQFLVLNKTKPIKYLERVYAKDLPLNFPVLYTHSNLTTTLIKVTKITKLTQRDDTYCFTEFNNNAGVFNGILTSQCSEIILPTDETRTAVCCLASLNLDYYDSWCNNEQFYLDVATYLDNVLQYFIDNAPRTLKRAIYSATNERAIGIGTLGFHSYLQSCNIAIESMEAYHLNNKIFKTISIELNKVNLILGSQRGEAPDCIGTGRRFSHMMAIAPNATSSIIMGNTSPSCEPFRANVYKQDTMSGSHITYNKHLKKILETRVKDENKLKEIISSIKMCDGSVQHLDILNDHEKKVFKTWPEINQMTLIRLAAARQKYIDQSQSLSLFFNPNESKKFVHQVHLEAWLAGLKTLYYFRSKKILTVDKVNHNSHLFVNAKLEEKEPEVCTFCEG